MIEIVTDFIELSSEANCSIFDITDKVQSIITKHNFKEGQVTVSGIGSTVGISTIEYEPGLLRDIPEFLDKILPEGYYNHDQTWHDGNGHSHLRSFLIKTSETFLFKDGELILGTWQQIIFLDFDNKPRRRRIAVQIIGRK